MCYKYLCADFDKVNGICLNSAHAGTECISVNDCDNKKSKCMTCIESASCVISVLTPNLSTGSTIIQTPSVGYAYVDGSYNPATKTYGYGGVLVDGAGNEFIFQGKGNSPKLVSMRNVAGEIAGAVAAVEEAKKQKMTELTIYYDYTGIENWAIGKWSAGKPGTIAYRDYMQKAKKELSIRFKKVKGHSGVSGNEKADLLAKKAVGI